MAVEPVDSSSFTVHRLPGPKQVEGSKVAAGMEAAFRITFTPDSTASFEQQLVVTTERERFLVPVVAVGAAAVLDIPDSITLPSAAAKKASKHSFLVRNVGRAAGSFQLSSSSSCFAVHPSHGELAPGDAMQLTVEFTPAAPGPHEGELEVLYDGSCRTSFTVLRGHGQQLDVGLCLPAAAQGLQLPKAHMGKLSQRSFQICNRSSTSVSWSIHSQPSAEAEAAIAYATLLSTHQQHSSSTAKAADFTCSISGALPPLPDKRGSRASAAHDNNNPSSHRISVSSSSCSTRSSAASSRCNSGNSRAQRMAGLGCSAEAMQVAGRLVAASDTDSSSATWLHQEQQQQQDQQQCHRPSTASSEGDTSMVSDSSLLAQHELSLLRQAKRARRDICADKQLFSSPFFSIFPPEGCVSPNSSQEVIVQFSPDSAGTFEALAWVDIQGLGERLPLPLHGEGLGPVLVLSFGEALDVGEAFVNMEQRYELELLNRGKVDAQWTLQPSHTRFGSKFSFSPESGMLAVGQGQLISVRLLSDCLGRFDEAFQLHLAGTPHPMNLIIRGEVVGPQFQLNAQLLDFNIASFGFRWDRLEGTKGLGTPSQVDRHAAWVKQASHTLQTSLVGGLIILLSLSPLLWQVHSAHGAQQHRCHSPGLSLARG